MDIEFIVKELKWPIVVLLSFIIITNISKDAIRNLINRIRKAGIGNYGFDADPTQPQSTDREQFTKTVNKARQEFLEVPDSIVQQEQEKLIRDTLKEKAVDDNDDKIDILVRELAKQQINYNFLYLYSIIYGSEVILLENLNSLAHGLSKEEIEGLIVIVKEKFPKRLNTKDIDDFLSTLISNMLVVYIEDRIQISGTGREFLVWLSKNGLSKDLSY